jgi:cysteine desulfurase/selenocysteine lyase
MANPFSSAEIARLRADTAGCGEAARVFFNNAGASLPPRPVVARVIEHLQLEEQIGAYEAADRTFAERDAVYPLIARMIGADASEIALTESATRAWDMAFYSIGFKPGDRIVTAQNEYSSNYIAFLQVVRRTGAVITVIPPAHSGEIDLNALEETLKVGGVKIVAVTHIATNNGMVQPAAEIGKLTRRYGVPFLLDACQSVGQLDLDVELMGCDMLSATGRKFLRAPRGTGFLYVRKSVLETLEPPFLDMRAADWTAVDAYTMRPDAKRFEGWESSEALTLGLGVAVNYALTIGLDRIEARVQMLAARLRTKLVEIEGVKVTDTGTNKSGIVIFIYDMVPSARLVSQLADHNVVARVSPRFGTRLDERLSALDDLVRASVHYYNTEDEIDHFCDVLATLVNAL